jgi:xanthine dehydrogenase large subunit
VTDRALFHCDNAYFYPRCGPLAPLYTNTVSNTAFRGFGGPQGMVGASASSTRSPCVGKDPLESASAISTASAERDVTPYHQTVEDNIIHRVVAELEAKFDYRRAARGDRGLQRQQPVKRGIALTPVKFGISFTATHFNQAGALVHVYTDGSVH